MRVISGRLGGRNFDAPKTNRTHPMSERMRGALFNTLGDIQDLSILDAFGGSGALSIEAISRGAARAVVVEVDKTAISTIKANLNALKLNSNIKAIRANVSAWSDNNEHEVFDLVLCNPPFDKLNHELIEKLTRHITSRGLLVLSWPTIEKAPHFAGLDVMAVKEKDYGDAQLIFYRKS